MIHCKTPHMARNALWAHLLGYNLVRKVAAQAAWSKDLLPRQISLTGATQILQAFRWVLITVGVDQKTHIYQVLFAAIATHQVGDRPERREPPNTSAAMTNIRTCARPALKPAPPRSRIGTNKPNDEYPSPRTRRRRRPNSNIADNSSRSSVAPVRRATELQPRTLRRTERNTHRLPNLRRSLPSRNTLVQRMLCWKCHSCPSALFSTTPSLSKADVYHDFLEILGQINNAAGSCTISKFNTNN